MSSSKNNSIIKNANANTKNANANTTNQNKGYRSHHTNYKPFLNYIENHSRVDAVTKESTKRIFSNLGIQPTNIQSSSGRKKKTNNNLQGSSSSSSSSINMISQAPNPFSGPFVSQKTSATKTKAERDDERHSDLHSNYKTKDYSDSDKIFLLKREVDSLRGSIQEQQEQEQQQTGIFTGSSLPLLTAFLLFGALMMSSRFLARKLRLLRASDSLLLDVGGNQDEREESIGFELQEKAPTGFFGALSSALEANRNETKSNSEEGLSIAYRAPSEEDTAIRFV